ANGSPGARGAFRAPLPLHRLPEHRRRRARGGRPHTQMNAPVSVGTRARRIEDPRLLRGAGRYAGDIDLPGLLHAAFVRSPHAHALIRAIDATAARETATVFTATDLERAGVRLRMPLGFPSTTLPENITPFVLAPSEVCFVGEAVAMVVADSRYLAEDAAAAIEVDYEPLPAVANLEQAM